MISFNLLGQWGRLGNQLFQYAFLRTTAKRLCVQFYCPEWIGDKIFMLDDSKVRAQNCDNIKIKYREPQNNCGFNTEALSIKDETDVGGCFQSEKYFKNEGVKSWYSFKDDVVSEVKNKYQHIPFSQCTGLHLRFGDMKDNLKYVSPSRDYYKEALTHVRHGQHILVFSDEMREARHFLEGIKREYVYIEGNQDYEDLYLMSRCHDFICSVSTLSWWGAWLNSTPDKTIVAPKEWIRPGHPVKNNEICPPDWVTIKTCRYLTDDFRLLNTIQLSKDRLMKAKTRNLKENVLSLKNYLRNKIKV